MMVVSAIVATSENQVIGKNNQIPWYLQKDLQFFKQTTLHHHVIMGRKSFESIGRPLPKRTNIVVTNNAFFVASGVLVAHSIEEALEMAYDNGETETFVIGGGTIYAQSQPFWDKIYWTQVHATVEGDVFFPNIEMKNWQEISSIRYNADQKNDFDFSIRIFEKITQKI